MKEVGFIPFEVTINREDNSVYWFHYSGSDDVPYSIRIVIDEFNDDLVIEKTCTCPSFTVFKKGEDCKHITLALEELKKWAIPFREK